MAINLELDYNVPLDLEDSLERYLLRTYMESHTISVLLDTYRCTQDVSYRVKESVVDAPIAIYIEHRLLI